MPGSQALEEDTAPSAPRPPKSDSSMSDADESKKEVKTKVNDFAKKPDAYDGSKAKFERFWNQILAYLTINKSRDLEDEVKILFVLSYMTSGAAERWAQNYRFKYFAEDDVATDSTNYDDYDSDQADAASVGSNGRTKKEKWADAQTDKRRLDSGQSNAPSWGNFVRALKKAFKDKSNNSKAIDQLQQLRQGSESVEEYRTKFEMLIDSARLNRTQNRAMLLNIVEAALNDSLVEAVYRTQGGPPNEYERFLDVASDAELLAQRLANRRNRRPRFEPRREEKPNTPSPRNPPARSPYEPKGYAAEKSGTAPINADKTWKMSIDQARRENKCRHCEATWTDGHDCEPKRLAQRAYQARAAATTAGGSSGARRIALQEQKDDAEAKVASLKDQVVLLSKQLAEQELKERGD